ncbi:MAG: YrdB family protein, partial [Haloarculaceae archaeon]
GADRTGMATDRPDAVGAATLGIRFLLELGALAAVGRWGFGVGTGATRYALALGAPLALAAAWGALVSPKAPWRLPDPWRLGAELVAFGLAVAALVAVGRPLLAGGFALLAIADEAVFVVRDLR